MKKGLRIALFLLGLGCIIAATFIFFTSEEDEHLAEDSSETVLVEFATKLESEIELQFQQETESAKDNLGAVLPGAVTETEKEKEPLKTLVAAANDPVIEIDGDYYLGILSIPQFGLSLPVVTVCNDENLKRTPCAYTGSVSDQNLTIVAHNYRAHFGAIHQMEEGDKVTILDAAGKLHTYRMIKMETIEEHQVEDFVLGDWDLTLFTCVYGKNTHRTVVRFREVIEE